MFSYYHPHLKKRDKLGLGSYPEFSLADVRAKREEYQRLLANNIDPRTYEAKLNKNAPPNRTTREMHQHHQPRRAGRIFSEILSSTR
nr:integrase arm-type DNA-binding domain-containing protein [Aggregatibacter segnis]